MTQPVPMAEVWRGDFLESLHSGHAVICDETGAILHAWGDPDAVILPRSSCKMVQALPLLDSGAADAAGLSSQHLALACASHQGAAIHTKRVAAWLGDLNLSESDLLCGVQAPNDTTTRHAMIRSGETANQLHHSCSGKHCGFLTTNKHLKGGPDYVAPDHPLQRAIRETFDDVTGIDSPGFGIDGCTAPNFATTVHGLARAMAYFAASSEEGATVRERSAARLTRAMIAHPELVAGEGRACTELIRATDGKAVAKTGAEGVFVAILPERKLGVALKIVDGATRASQCAIAALLVKLGVLDANHPATNKWLNAPILNRRGTVTGYLRSSYVF